MILALIALTASAQAFQIASNDLKPGSKFTDEYIYKGFGCMGGNVSPELHWKDAPKDTKSFAITVYDPDAPTGSGFWHWIAYDIPAATTRIAKGEAAGAGKSVANDFGEKGYGGPCPPPGKVHHYWFTVHALKAEKLEIPEGATNAVVRFYIEGATIGKAKTMATYKRQ